MTHHAIFPYIFPYLHSVCDVNWRKAAYFCTRAFILGEAAAAIEWQVFYFLQRNGWLPGTLPYGIGVMALTYVLVFGGLYLLERRYAEGNAQMAVSWQQLDTILTARSLQCQREGIVLTCTADGSALDFMNAMDISILFGNALDNAIESVSIIPEQEKRLIHLTVSRQKSFVRIHMENCYEGELKMVGGMPVTRKQDTDFHGFGLKSIGTIVDKYGGSMTVRAENGWFELRVLFNQPV